MAHCPDCDYGFFHGDCKYCRGSGKRVELEETIEALYNEDVETCNFCFGTGQCQLCGGTGVIYEDDTYDKSYEQNSSTEYYSGSVYKSTSNNNSDSSTSYESSGGYQSSYPSKRGKDYSGWIIVLLGVGLLVLFMIGLDKCSDNYKNSRAHYQPQTIYRTVVYPQAVKTTPPPKEYIPIPDDPSIFPNEEKIKNDLVNYNRWPYKDLDAFKYFHIKFYDFTEKNTLLRQYFVVIMFNKEKEAYYRFQTQTEYKLTSNNEWELMYVPEVFQWEEDFPLDGVVRQDLQGIIGGEWEFIDVNDDLKTTGVIWKDNDLIYDVVLKIKRTNTTEVYISEATLIYTKREGKWHFVDVESEYHRPAEENTSETSEEIKH